MENQQDISREIIDAIMDSIHFGVDYDILDYLQIPGADCDAALDDILSDILDNGGAIKILDFDAEGVIHSGWRLPARRLEDGTVAYTVTKADIQRGLLRKEDFQKSDSADVFLQEVLFGKVVYDD